jgi:hypothetical protein
MGTLSKQQAAFLFGGGYLPTYHYHLQHVVTPNLNFRRPILAWCFEQIRQMNRVAGVRDLFHRKRR